MKEKEWLYQPRHYNDIELWKNVSHKEWNDAFWQQKNALKTVDQLAKVIQLNDYQNKEIEKTIIALRKQGKESLRITPYYASLMNHNPFESISDVSLQNNDLIDPIFWQSVPTPANLMFPNTGKEGAMAEGSRSYGAAYQRYPNRVALFVAENTSCASYCTHCQRTKSLDSTCKINQIEINKALFYVNFNKNIDEVLVTGGDALMIGEKRLLKIIEELIKIEHLKVIRIATRVPVVLPMAIKNKFLEKLRKLIDSKEIGDRKHVYFMTHVNHYHEITPNFVKAIHKIMNFGFPVRNQTVLLNHVNNDFSVLAETFRRMLWAGVHPYYLLQCHKEKGLVHFITPIQIGKIFLKNLQGWISGITRPTYAANVEGGGGKILLMPTGHDTLNIGIDIDIESKISESFASVYTWDRKIIDNYEALGRTSREEFVENVKLMDNFFGRAGIFKPFLIIIDEKGNHLETTHRKELPELCNEIKANILNYRITKKGLPLNNPAEIADELDKQFRKSRYFNY